jgi:amino acid transporter
MSLKNNPRENNPAMPDQHMEKVKPPRALLAAVIIMGVLLVVGLIVVIATVISRVSQSGGKNTVSGTTSTPLAVETPIPANMQVRSMQINGNNLVVHIGPKTGGENQFIVYDIKRGKEHARFILKQK